MSSIWHGWQYYHDGESAHQRLPRFVDGKGATLVDEHGRQYIDARSGMLNASLGYASKSIIEAASRGIRMPGLPTNSGFSNNIAEQLAEKLLSLTGSDDYRKVWYSLSGTAANEVALLATLRHFQLRGERERKIVVSWEWSYHGCSLYTLSVSGFSSMTDCLGCSVEETRRIPRPHCFRCPWGECQDTCGDRCSKELSAAIEAIDPKRIAAFIFEPIQCVGGVVPPPAKYLHTLQQLALRHGFLLIADEVVTGIGRCGEWFLSISDGMRPDIITVSKGLSGAYLPLAATLFGNRCMEAFDDSKEVMLCGGSSMDGFPASCAVALDVLSSLETGNLLQRVRELEPVMRHRLGELRDSPFVGDVRGKGLLWGVDFVVPGSHEPFIVEDFLGPTFLSMGVVPDLVASVWVVCPPLCITEAELQLLFQRGAEVVSVLPAAQRV